MTLFPPAWHERAPMRSVPNVAIALLRSGRPGVALPAGLAAALAALFARVTPWTVVLAAGITTTLITMLTMVVNDVYDFDKDRLAGVSRPIPLGMVSRVEATLFAVLLLATALLTAPGVFFQSLAIPNAAALRNTANVLLVVSVLTGVLYSPFSRRLPLFKSVYAAVACALPSVYGAMLGDKSVAVAGWVTIVLFNLGREVFLDAHDLSADLRAGLRTMAAVVGRARARAAGIVVMLAGALTLALFGGTSLGTISGATGALLLAGAVASRAVSDEGLRHLTRVVLAIGALGVASTVA
jgi:4-hydroxybenzoate polyprenyltransferase